MHNRQISKLTFHEISTGKGQIVSVKLIDGTRIKLNSESILKVPSDYEDKREIYLKGEAYFEVKPFKNLKFIVKTDEAIVEVLGTKFNIRAYPEDKKVTVIVSDGKVALYPVQSKIMSTGGNIEKVILKKGQMAYVYNGKVSSTKFADLDYELAWLEGEIKFTPFLEVIKYLERRYNVKCTVSDSSMLKRKFTGSFKFEKLDEILTIISLALELKYNYSDGLIIFEPKSKNAKTKQKEVIKP